jgi:hypothetical protein
MNWIKRLRKFIREAHGGAIHGPRLESMLDRMTEQEAQAMVRVIESIQQSAEQEGVHRAKRRGYIFKG